MLPEWREILRLRRVGELDKLQDAREVRVTTRLDGGTAQQISVSGLLSMLVAPLKRQTPEDESSETDNLSP
jgi:hypothetical protein